MSTRHNNLRTTRSSFDFTNVRLNAVFDSKFLPRNLLTIGNNCFGSAQIYNNVISLKASNMTTQNFSDTILIFIKDLRTLSVSNFLHYNLLGSLGSDTSKARSVDLYP